MAQSTRIALAVTGSIAAFKGAQLASDLVKRGFGVRVILTAGGARFLTPLTFEAITGSAVSTEVWDEQPGTSRMGHLELARWADLLVVAPASANSLARLALGLADDMLGSVALSSRVPLLLAPAMESGMWDHPATQEHVRTLVARGALVVGPERGRLASGAMGMGRMSEPETIVEAVLKLVEHNEELEGRRVLVTAGPTYEAIDPVRFIGNRSSGKMGFAVAEEARARGATVVLVTGPTALLDPAGMEVVHVESQAEMRGAVLERAPHQDVIVMAAAVADFRPASTSPHKIKRRDQLSLRLVRTEDIAAEIARVAPHVLQVGFALETTDLVARAREKMARKGQRLVVANSLSPAHNPFGADTNQVALVREDGVTELPPMGKREVAARIWDEVGRALSGDGGTTTSRAEEPEESAP